MNMNDFIEMLQEMGVRHSIDGDKIFVAENLDLCDTNITSLPDNLSVDGSLDLDNTCITHLPKNLSVGGGLDLRYTGITSLPDNLNVGGCLYLKNTRITRLPNNLKVGGFIHLDPEEIINIAYRKFLRDGDYTVFAAWINGRCCVVVNSMIYTLEEFYGETPTADAERAARECVAELEQRRKYAECSMSNSSELLQSIQEMHEAGVLADYVCQVEPLLHGLRVHHLNIGAGRFTTPIWPLPRF